MVTKVDKGHEQAFISTAAHFWETCNHRNLPERGSIKVFQPATAHCPLLPTFCRPVSPSGCMGKWERNGRASGAPLLSLFEEAVAAQSGEGRRSIPLPGLLLVPEHVQRFIPAGQNIPQERFILVSACFLQKKLNKCLYASSL